MDNFLITPGQNAIQAPEDIPLIYVVDIIRAYKLSAIGCSELELKNLSLSLSKIKKTFTHLKNVVSSTRYPYVVMEKSAKIGMYIPPRQRCGILAYEFFINNIRHYETVRNRVKVPPKEDLYLASDPFDLLLSMRDDQILVKGYKFTRNYTDRTEMIKDFIRNNLLTLGRFELPSNVKESYDAGTRLILYQRLTYGSSGSGSGDSERGSGSRSGEMVVRERYSVGELTKMIAAQLSGMNHKFDRLAVMDLKKKILVKISQWRQSDNNSKSGPPDLLTLLGQCEAVTNENNIRSSYLEYLICE